MGLLIRFHITLSKLFRRQVHDILKIIIMLKYYITETKRETSTHTQKQFAQKAATSIVPCIAPPSRYTRCTRKTNNYCN